MIRVFMKALVVRFIFFGLVFSLRANGQEENNLRETPPLFVSLGSHCDVAHTLRACEMRESAFPFDWIVSMDLEGLITILRDDFKYFLDESCLKAHGLIGDIPLLNTYYHLEFLHEGSWKKQQYALTMKTFKSKYEMRIERFRRIRNYPGKVYFIRQAYPGSLTDPHRVYKYEDNIEISEDHARSLYQALKAYFIDLDFCLIVLNQEYEGRMEVKEIVEEHLIMAKINESLDRLDRNRAFKSFFVDRLEKK